MPTDLERAVLGLHDLATTTTASAEHVLGTHGLSLTSGLALWWLDPEADPLTMGEIATGMRCSAANVTYVLDRLDSAGLVRRSTASSDKRRRVVALTRQGVQVRSDMIATVLRDSPLARLSASELRSLLHVLATASAQSH
ncbi:MarR family winged helix-turn-helix transcriptional regulator [Nocardioides hwasunensis]|uniref:MarR family transcriptional regulator n=1 Tax=Nocardioides hwasunensis TaxID=397258 RepID=A0ABR8MP59_9ACTN|nr:MarR family transcriptional regulator [Nocardioides hwasunensis]MBD3915904.1 MarR family transcriptional regulator [Nocardioides hwasunensis]